MAVWRFINTFTIVFLSRDCDKSKRFLEGIKQDPIERVVASHCIDKFLI